MYLTLVSFTATHRLPANLVIGFVFTQVCSAICCGLIRTKTCRGWSENDRGVSFTFGADVVSKFLNRHDLDLICRAHQVVEDGYEFFAKRQLVTLFSAPNYCGEFDNAGGMMSVDETLMCSFQVSLHQVAVAGMCLASRSLIIKFVSNCCADIETF